ncbi:MULTISPECIES: DUF6789 family protein [Salinibaculum]|uniref:DUF6789 family protein n=1 Tax=Salinibaculum TaxID=2732368 RepID=UPI0030D26676
MPDGTTELEDAALAEEGSKYDRLGGIVADGVVGAAGGLVGVAMMTVVLLVAESFGAFSRESFGALARLVGLGGLVPEVTVGYLIFLAGGMFPWPLLFASLKEYLPGDSWPVAGVFFGTALWTGFVGAFYAGFGGVSLVLYLVLTLVAHWVYGASLGLVFSYLSERPDTLV